MGGQAWLESLNYVTISRYYHEIVGWISTVAKGSSHWTKKGKKIKTIFLKIAEISVWGGRVGYKDHTLLPGTELISTQIS